MPIISVFLGLVVRVFHADHPPPHLHVQYGEHEAIFDISTGRTIAGRLPPRQGAASRVAPPRRGDIMNAWLDAQAMRPPRRVKPLE
ncbi:MAG: DUF4160 domain-containing protein [Deltaproteobacteria bacterium]|nr:DUF4160 domain-containing protein [Deltaproteobacteria bacterium]